MEASHDALQIVPVSSNVSWANTPIIALYCTQYKALFGSVNLKQELAMKMSGVSFCSANHCLCCTSQWPLRLAPAWWLCLLSARFACSKR